jgi:UDP-sulfoquinovose synthase
VECVRLACENPADRGEFRVFNQATEQFSLQEMAKTVQNSFPGQVDIEYVDNPRVEAENHYYNFTHTALESLGLQPHLLSDTLLHHMFDVIERHQDRVDRDLLKPRINWRDSHRTTS